MDFCKDNCGFYGQPSLRGYCSVCVHKHMEEQTSQDISSTKVEYTQDKVISVEQPNRSRCKKCSKKVGLLGHECSCTFTFCSKHRHPEDHECEFDHMEFGKKQVEKNNPLLYTDKMVRLD